MSDEITTSEKIVMALAIPVAILTAFGIGFLLLLIANMIAGDLTPFELSTFCFDATNVAEELICNIAG
jgi:hypothetical protein